MATLDEIVKRSYSFRVDADLDAGGWVIRFPDLPGCMTQADSFEEVGAMAQDAFEGWATDAYEMGHDIPVPSDTDEHGFQAWPRGLAFTQRSDRNPSLTSREVAKRLDVTPRRITALAKERGVGVQKGREWLFSEDDVVALKPRSPGRPRKEPTAASTA